MLRSMGPFLAIAVLALALFALYFVIKSTASTGMKVIWIILILILPFVGALAYFLVNGTGAPTSDAKRHDGTGDINRMGQTK